MKKTVEAKELSIAAKIMQAAGLCRYDTPTKCQRAYTDDTTCAKCIKAWMISKAKQELRKEAKA